jgi:hypothetical protein
MIGTSVRFLGKPQVRACAVLLSVIVAGVLVGLFVVQPVLASASVLNVKDFGAQGDGVTDDTAAIQSAIDQAGADPVYLPSGTYVVSGPLSLRSSLTLHGDGASSIIKLVGGDDWTRVLVGDRLTGLTLRDLKVDGNAASGMVTGTGEQRHCIFLYACADSVVERVTVIQPLGDGIFLYAGCSGVTIRDCVAIAGTTNNPRVGINVQGANACLVTGNTVTGFNCAYKAELDPGDSASTGNRIIGNVASGGLGLGLLGTSTGHVIGYVVESNTLPGGIWVSNADNCTIRGNTLGGEGVYACYGNTNLLVENNAFSGCSYTDVYLGEIYELGPSSGIRVTGNTFASGSRAQGIIFHVGTTVTNVEIDNNTYATGETFYNPVYGATANVHDNVEGTASATTSSTTTSSTTTSSTTSTTVATSTTATTVGSTRTTAAPAATTSTSTTTTAVSRRTTTTTAATTTTTIAATTTTTEPTEGSTEATVTITSPTDQSSVQGRVTVSATVTSSAALAKVLFFVDGLQKGQDYSAPYSYVWVASSAGTGTHTLMAIAYDRYGSELGRGSCQVTVVDASAGPSRHNWLR